MGWIVSANLLALVAVVVAVAALVTTLVFHFTEEDEEGGTPAVAQPTVTAQVTPTLPTPTPPTVVEVSVDDDPSVGPEDAAVTIVEFSDYQ